MLHSRKCPQTSAGVWHRARPQERPEVHEGGALASEAGAVWVNMQALFFTCFSVLPQDGAVQAAPPGVVHVDVAAPWRSEEAVGSISQDTQDTQIQWSLFSWFHPAPQTVFSFRILVVSRSESRGVFFLLFWLFGCHQPRIFPQFHETCVMFLLCRMFTFPHHSDDAWASRRQLLQSCSSATVVWSDESFFWLREQPNHQITMICWGQPCNSSFSIQLLPIPQNCGHF